MTGYLTIAAFAVVALGMVAFTMALGKFLRPSDPNPTKLETYECGPAPVGDAWGQFNLHYYLYALLFVVFDVEAAFLFPWVLAAPAARAVYGAAFLLSELAIFVGLLIAAWAWSWRREAFEWE